MICGHIHHAAIRDINGVLYSNAGDWVESCTALVENASGTMGIINWHDATCSPEPVKPKAPFGRLEKFRSPLKIKPNVSNMPQASK